MKPQAIRTTETDDMQTPGLGERTYAGMSASKRDQVKLANILATQYSEDDSVLRELITNAIESVREAGTGAKAIVTLPATSVHSYYHEGDNNLLSVYDQGLGMSYETIMDVLLTFGVSTKDNSDDVAGGMGIGGFSPLHLSSTFWITSAKDGELNKVEVSHDENGIARDVIARATWDTKTLTVPGSNGPREVSLPADYEGWNGENFTRIEVPIAPDRARSMNQAIRDRLNFYSADEVEVTNPEYADEVGTRLGENERRYKNVGIVQTDRDNVVSGAYAIVRGVAYNISNFDWDHIYRQVNIANPYTPYFYGSSAPHMNFYLELDDVFLAGPREGLSKETKTYDALVKALSEAGELFTAESNQAWEAIESEYRPYLDSDSEDGAEVTAEVIGGISTAYEQYNDLYLDGSRKWAVPSIWSDRNRSSAVSNLYFNVGSRAMLLTKNGGGVYSRFTMEELSESKVLYVTDGVPESVLYGRGSKSESDAQNSDEAGKYAEYEGYLFALCGGEPTNGSSFYTEANYGPLTVGLDALASLIGTVVRKTTAEVAEDAKAIRSATHRAAVKRRNAGKPAGDKAGSGERSAPSYRVLTVDGAENSSEKFSVKMTDVAAKGDEMDLGRVVIFPGMTEARMYEYPARWITAITECFRDDKVTFIPMANKSVDRLRKRLDEAGIGHETSLATPDMYLRDRLIANIENSGLTDESKKVATDAVRNFRTWGTPTVSITTEDIERAHKSIIALEKDSTEFGDEVAQALISVVTRKVYQPVDDEGDEGKTI